MRRKVIGKLGKSPMNSRVNLVLLDCGHELFSAARLRVGSAINCDKCDIGKLLEHERQQSDRGSK